MRVFETEIWFFPNWLPFWHNGNIRRYYLLILCTQSYVISAVWLYFFLLFVNYGQLGILDGLAFALAWLVDIPTGALADRFGRRLLLIIGCVCGCLGGLVMACATGVLTLFTGNLLYLCAYSFFSGAQEALAYESLRDEEDRNAAFSKVTAGGRSLGIAVHVAASIAGAWLYELNPRAPFLAVAVLMLGGLWVSIQIRETLSPRTLKNRREGFIDMLSESRVAFSRSFLPFVIYALGVTGVYTAFCWGYLRPALAVRFGFSAMQLSYILGASYCLSFFAVSWFPKLRERSGDGRGLLWCGMLLGLCFAAAALNLGAWGAILFPLIATLGQFAPAWLSVVMNQKLEDRNRATILSTVGFMEKLLYCILAWGGGYVLQAGAGGVLFLSLGVLSLGAALVAVAILKAAPVSG